MINGYNKVIEALCFLLTYPPRVHIISTNIGLKVAGFEKLFILKAFLISRQVPGWNDSLRAVLKNHPLAVAGMDARPGPARAEPGRGKDAPAGPRRWALPSQVTAQHPSIR